METIESINKSRKASLKHSIKALQSALGSLEEIQKEKDINVKGHICKMSERTSIGQWNIFICIQCIR